MGVHLQLSPHLLRLMSPEDQTRYGVVPDPAPALQLDRQPTHKTTTDERKQQSDFANWLLLRNSEVADIPFEWHPIHARSKTTPGCFDFWVGVSSGIWIEFKADRSCKLSGEQQEFKRKCEKRGIPAYVVYSAAEAIEIVRQARAVQPSAP